MSKLLKLDGIALLYFTSFESWSAKAIELGYDRLDKDKNAKAINPDTGEIVGGWDSNSKFWWIRDKDA